MAKKKKGTSEVNVKKIFDNSYESTDISTTKIDFVIDSSVDTEMSMEDQIDHDLIYTKIENCILGSDFESLNKPNDEGKYKKLSKAEINKLYSFVVNKIPKVSKIQIFSMLSEYFDINYHKFYDSLSNTFKQKLIEELEYGDDTVTKKIGGKLF